MQTNKSWGLIAVTWCILDPVQKGHNAERPLVAPLQGAGYGGGLYPGWRLAPAEPRLPWAILGCPFGAPNGQIFKEKLKFQQEICAFHAISSSFSVLLKQKQVVRNLVIAVYLLNQLLFLCLL
ncbi:MAG: hypothetical protein RBT25_10580 [Lentisphaeria bacterium]|nr:hypothetical protein [Lentisphaeria bacterium]